MPHLIIISSFSKENRKDITWFVWHSPCLLFCRIYKICSWKLCVLWLCEILCIKVVIMLWFIFICWDVWYKGYIYMVNMNFTCNTFLLHYSKNEMWNFQVPYLKQWSDVEGGHASCLRGATTALYNASLRLPIIGSVNVGLQYFITHHFVHRTMYHVVNWYACRPTARNLQKSLSQQHNYLNRFHLASKISYQRWDYRDFWKTYIPKQCDA